MKKLLVTLFLLFAALTATAGDAMMLKLRIIENLAHLLVQGKAVPKVYVDPGLRLPLESSNLSIEPVSDCRKADILFVTDIADIAEHCTFRKDQRIVTFSYRDYLHHKNSATGAFFWQKGRPNIVINATKVRQLHLHIPRAYEKYVE